MSDARNRRLELLIGLAAIAMVIVLWTSFLLLSRHAAKGVLTSWDLAALRFFVSGTIMLPILLWRGNGGHAWWQSLVLTLTAGPGFALFAYAGLELAPAANGGILMPGVLPLMTAVFGFFLLQEPLGRQRAIALSLIVAGIAATGWSALTDTSGESWQTTMAGNLCFLTASTSWALFTVLARRWQVAPLTAASTIAPLAMLLFAPFYFLLLPSRISEASWAEIWLQGAFQGVGAVILVLIAFTTAIRYLGAQMTTMFTATVPGLAAILAVPLLGEPLSVIVILGLTLVTFGIVTAATSMRQSA